MASDSGSSSGRVVRPSSQALSGSSGTEAVRQLCEEIMELDDIKACAIINYHGAVLAEILGELPQDDELKARGGPIAAVIWGGLKKVEPAAGPISFVSAVFEKFKIVGIPLPEHRIAVLLTVDINVDSFHLKDIVGNYVKYSFQLDAGSKTS